MEGNITRLRGEARDANARIRSPLADNKDGAADAEEKSESTADDSTEERESLEESERSLRSDEEDDSSEAGARRTAEKSEGTESSTLLTALVVQCKVQYDALSLLARIQRFYTFYYCIKSKEDTKTAPFCSHDSSLKGHSSFVLPLQRIKSLAGPSGCLVGGEQQITESW